MGYWSITKSLVGRTRVPMRSFVLVTFVSLILAYVGVLVWLRLKEDSLIFAPDVSVPSSPMPELRLKSRDIMIRGPGSERLSVRLIPPPAGSEQSETTWLLYLHGSSGNIGLPAYNEAWAHFRDVGLGVFALDYRGFGLSEGAVSEAGLYEDAQAAYEHLRLEMRVPPERIVIYGFSMGAAVAIDLATRVEAAALLVEGSWLSVPALGQERYPFVPVSLIAKNRFDSASKIGRVKMPKLFLHATMDEAIPVAHSEKLFGLAREPKRFRKLGGTHGTSHHAGPEFFLAVTQFLEEQKLQLL